MHEYSKISLRTLTIVLSTRGFAWAPRFRALEIHWTAKCYELTNKEAATWHENRAVTICPAFAGGGPRQRDNHTMAKTYRDVVIEQMIAPVEDAMSGAIDWWGELPTPMNEAIDKFRVQLE